MAKAYEGLSTELLETPLPEGLTEDILIQVKSNLKTMATPYKTVASDYRRLLGEEVGKLSNTEKDIILQNLEMDSLDYTGFIKQEVFSVSLSSDIDYSGMSPLKEKLKNSPNQLETLVAMKDYFKLNNNDRMAAYFTGRITNLEDSNE